MRKNIKYENLLVDFHRVLAERRGQNNFLLESERLLAEMFGASRRLVRKALQELELNGEILREKHTNQIVPAQKQRYRYGFIATVHHDNGTFWYHFYQRVWQKLTQLTARLGYQIEFFGYDPEDPNESFDEFLQRLSQIDLIFLSLTDQLLATTLAASNNQTICLNSTNYLPDYPLIAVDNAAVGRLGAELLLSSDCKKTAAVSVATNQNNPAFKMRIDNFSKTMKNAGIYAEIRTEYASDLMSEITCLSEYVSTLPERGFDGLFFLSDEYCDLVTASLFNRGLVPEQIAIVAFDGSVTARSHHPPITTISHCSQEMAEQILLVIQQFEYQNKREKLSAYINLLQPKVYPGRTLRKMTPQLCARQ